MDVRLAGFHERTLVKDALKVIFKNISTLKDEEISFDRALHRVLAEDVISDIDNPPFDRAAMDGFAVKGENTFGASQDNPLYFKVVGKVLTGAKANFRAGEFKAVKIMTGSPLPEGANAVVMFEYTKEVGSEIEVVKAVTPGKNVSLKGEDVKKGDTLLKRGRVLRPQDIGILAATGKTRIKVYRKPRVAIISTGDELIEPSGKLKEGQIYDSNSYALASLVEMNGGNSNRVGIVRDDYEKLQRAIRESLDSDIILISGATSVGERDIIPEIVGKLGKILFHGVSMRPGQPTGFGIIKSKPVFMLPGYPVASIVAFETFVRPCIQRMQGSQPWNPYPQVKARLNRKIPSEIGRRDFVRVRLDRGGKECAVEPIRTKGSGIISSLVKADGFVIVPENREGIKEGEEVVVNVYKNL